MDTNYDHTDFKSDVLELKELQVTGIIDEDEFKKLRQPLLDRLLKSNEQKGSTKGSTRPKGTPSSAEFVKPAANSVKHTSCSVSDAENSPVLPTRLAVDSGRKTTFHATATLRPDVPTGKRLKTVHAKDKQGTQHSLFGFCFTKTKTMADGSSVTINDDGSRCLC